MNARVLGIVLCSVVMGCATPESDDVPTDAPLPTEADADDGPTLIGPKQPVLADAVAEPPDPDEADEPEAPEEPPPEEPLPAGVPMDVTAPASLTLEQPAEGLPIQPLAITVGVSAGVTIRPDEKNAAVQHTRIAFFGTERVPKGGFVPWFQSVLAQYRLALVDDAAGGWSVVEKAALARGPYDVRVSPRQLEKLADRDGLYVTTTFRLAPGLDAARWRNVLANLSTRVAALGRVDTGAAEGTLDVTDFAPTVATMAHVLASLDALAPGQGGWRTEPAARVEGEPLELHDGTHKVTELLAWAARELDLVIYYDPRSSTVRHGNVGFEGDVEIERGRAFAWFRRVLQRQRLAVAPVGSGGRRWMVLDQAHPDVSTRAQFVDGERVDDLDALAGAYVATTFRLREGVDASRHRNALSNLSTKTAGLGRVMAIGDALVVGDFATNVASMKGLLQALGGGSPEAETATSNRGSVERVVGWDGGGVSGLVAWAHGTTGVTFHFDPHNYTWKRTHIRVHGKLELEPGEVVAWTRSILRPSGLGVVPLFAHDGPGAQEWAFMESADPNFTSNPLPVRARDIHDSARYGGAYVSSVLPLRAGVKTSLVRRALSIAATREAALGRVIDVPPEQSVVVSDFASKVDAMREILERAGLAARDTGSRTDLGRLLGRGSTLTTSVEPRAESGMSLANLLDQIAAATGHAFVRDHTTGRNVRVEVPPASEGAAIDDLLRRLSNALQKHDLALVPVFTARGENAGTTWSVIPAGHPGGRSHPVVVGSDDIASLSGWRGLYVMTPFQLADGVDTAAVAKKLKQLSTKTAGIGQVMWIEDEPLIVVADYAWTVAAMRESLADSNALR